VLNQKQLAKKPFDYQVPVQDSASWPTFRRDHRNTGHSPIRASYHSDRPWSFQTGKGVFSTPIIDGSGTIYVGSADHYFYALNPDGAVRWRFETGEIVDSAGALPRIDPEVGQATVIFPSGDGYLYCLRADDGSPLWTFDARVSPRASYNNWFEAHVAIGYDGTLYAGNTNFNYYALNADGTPKWTYETGANAWSCAAFAADGTIFWGSLDTRVRAVSPDGIERWSRRTLGFVTASAAVGSDGTVYIGSFDSYLYALDPASGRTRWKFKTGDHIYGSAALDSSPTGETSAIYVGSADGMLYALQPDGKLLWRHDTGAPIRSSPVLGRAPDGEPGDIAYFGCGNGRLYALNTVDGTRRWSFDTTSKEPYLRDRNDLNGSPALGWSGIYIGGEHGQVWYVPYDYPLHAGDERCDTRPGEELDGELTRFFFVTPGGNTQVSATPPVSPASVLTLRLAVRRGGNTRNAWVHNSPLGRRDRALQIRVEPQFPFHVEQSADGRYLHIIPESFLEPDTPYTVHLDGNYYSGGLPIGNLTLGGRKTGTFSDSVSFRTSELKANQLPLALSEHETSAFEWTRLAVPIPPMLPSLNQIGFDYMDWIVGLVSITKPDKHHRGSVTLWAIGGQRDRDGTLVADPGSDFMLPLSGSYRGDAFILTSRRFNMAITGIPIPFNLFQLRGQLAPDLQVRPGATVYADAKVLSIPTFGPYLVIAGLANNWWQKLLALGTYVTRPYNGPANLRPRGISVAALHYRAPTRFRPGALVAQLSREPGATYLLADHRPGLLLLDANNGEVVVLDYQHNIESTADHRGNLSTVTLTIPPRTRLPEALHAIVMLDVYPMHRQTIA
jgi:outer membrane protein assembly factor BamB